MAAALQFREQPSNDLNEFYQLNREFDKKSLPYYYCGYVTTFGAMKLNTLLTTNLQDAPEFQSVNNGLHQKQQGGSPIIISDNDSYNAAVKAPCMVSRSRPQRKTAVPLNIPDILQEEEDSNSLADGSLIYEQHSVLQNRKKLKFRPDDDPDYDPFSDELDAPTSKTISTPSLLSGVSSWSTLTTSSLGLSVIISSKKSAALKSVDPKPIELRSAALRSAALMSAALMSAVALQTILVDWISVNPTFSFTGNGECTQELMKDLLSGIQETITKCTISAVTYPQKESGIYNATQTNFTYMDASIHAVLSCTVSIMTAPIQPTKYSSVQVGRATTHAATQTSLTSFSVPNKKCKLDTIIKPQVVLKAQTAGLRRHNEEDSDDELNHPMDMV